MLTIKCSGGDVCFECQKYNENCVYRQFYRKIKRLKYNNDNSKYTQLLISAFININRIDNFSNEQMNIPEFISVRNLNDDSSSIEFFGPASNISFVNQLNHYLRKAERNGYDFLSEGQNDITPEEERKGLEKFGMKLMVLKDNANNFDFSLSNITTEKMNGLLIAYLETWHIPCPIFKAEDLFNLSVRTWKNPSASVHDKALLYLILSIGSAASYFDLQSNSSTLPLARGFFNLALRTVPHIFTELSLDAIRIVFFMSVSAGNLGDTALSYLYSGTAVRMSLAIGLHKCKNFSNDLSDKYQNIRLWVSVWQWEGYWSFCVGRPSCSRQDIPIPAVPNEAFSFSGYGEHGRFLINHEHMRLRVFFSSCCSKIQSEIYSTNRNLLSVLQTVEQISKEVDKEYFSSTNHQLIRSEIGEYCKTLDINSCREWFWIRIYYLYLKLMIFRPFLIFLAYVNISKTSAPDDIIEGLKRGSDQCVQEAIDISKFIVQLNRKVRMLQPIFFICTYLESACTVLLFYIASNSAKIQGQLATEIWAVLRDTCSFLQGSSGPYVGSVSTIAKDALESLNNILVSKKYQDNSVNNTYFDKVMQHVLVHSPAFDDSSDPKFETNRSETPTQYTLDDSANDELMIPDLQGFWEQTLDWINN